jgi:hypothetical protein
VYAVVVATISGRLSGANGMKSTNQNHYLHQNANPHTHAPPRGGRSHTEGDTMITNDLQQRRADFMKRFDYPADYQWVTDGCSWLAPHGNYMIHVLHYQWPDEPPCYFWFVDSWEASENYEYVLHYTDVCEEEGYKTLEQAQSAAINAFKRQVLKES